MSFLLKFFPECLLFEIQILGEWGRILIRVQSICSLTGNNFISGVVRLGSVNLAFAPLSEAVDGNEVGPVLAVGVGHHTAQLANDFWRSV